ncbi:sugar phosphate isomerase/epimerase [Galbitalea soli]|nr:sugar phosphate isomerase/epimerase [Galbitalea soli]
MSHPQLSVQLYTVREAIQADLPGTLQRLADIGFSNVEPFAFTQLPGLGDALAAAGLSAPTTHANYLGKEVEPFFATAQELGIPTVIDPYVTPEYWLTAADIEKTAELLNAAAQVAAAYGVRVGYHNHAHEIESRIGDQTALEYFAGLLEPGIVLEVDTYWVTVGGGDPVALLRSLGDRVVALHIKDGPGTADTKDQVAVGSGVLPVADIIAAAPTALRVVELDDSRGDRFTAVADSYAYLVAVGLA